MSLLTQLNLRNVTYGLQIAHHGRNTVLPALYANNYSPHRARCIIARKSVETTMQQQPLLFRPPEV